MEYTARQRAVIGQRGGDLIVSASAGSGKTEVLARRCVTLLADADAPASLDRMLIVTFTRAAAAELRERIGRMLRADAAETNDRALRRQLLRQERLLDIAEIGTIDAWCGRIVRRNFEIAGVDPGFSMLSAEAGALLRAATLDQVFDDIAAGKSALAESVQEWMGRQAKPGEGFFRGFIEKLNLYRDHLVDPQSWLAAFRARLNVPSAVRRQEAQSQLLAALHEDIAQFVTAAREIAGDVEKILEWIEVLDAVAKRSTTPSSLLPLVAAVNTGFPTKPRKASDDVTRIYVSCRKLHDRLKKPWGEATLTTILESLPEADALMRVLLDLEEHYHVRLMEAKRSRQAYEFGDVLRFALNLLQRVNGDGTFTPSPLALRLQSEYQHILVDEFQDTNPIQVRLFELVSRRRPAGNLFTVGDVKQSIYGFRRAEPRLFTARLAKLRESEEGHALFLSENFRSRPEILSALNLLFERLFSPELGGTAYGDEEKLRAGREADATGDSAALPSPRVCLQLIDLPEKSGARRDEDPGHAAEADDADSEIGAEDLKTIELEAAVIATEIHKCIAAGETVPDPSPEDPTRTRPLRYGDIAVLLRSARVNSSLVAGMFRKRQIPAVAGGRESIFSTHEVNDVVNVLRLLVNEDRDVVLAAHLRSPLVGLSAKELLAIRTAATGVSFIHAVRAFARDGQAVALRQTLAGVLQRLQRWRVASHTEPVALLLNRIIRETNVDFIARGRKLFGEHRLAAMNALRQLAEAQESTAVADFVTLLDRLEEAGQEAESTILSSQDAVRIMTIHGSKGLEFPVVFVANMGAKWNFNSGGGATRFDDDIGIGVSFFNARARTRLTSVEHFLIKRRAEQRDREEELRLLYVAATRAREALYLVGHAKNDSLAEYRATTWPPSGAVPLWRRENANSVLDWVLMAIAAAESASGETERRRLVEIDEIECDDARTDVEEMNAVHPDAAVVADELDVASKQWQSDAIAMIRAARAVERNSPQIAMSISRVKKQSDGANRQATAGDNNAGSSHELLLPQFVEPLRESPTDVGLVTHKFMEHVAWRDLGNRASIEAALAHQCTSGLLTDAEAAMLDVDALEWFGQSELARWVLQHQASLQREFPFVYGKPSGDSRRTLLRGVVDAVIHDGAGLHIIDYKTDRVDTDLALRRRINGYAVQLRLYGEATGAILGQPVARGFLVFLHARRIEPVDMQPFSEAEFRDMIASKT